jgi:hypothetical protein
MPSLCLGCWRGMIPASTKTSRSCSLIKSRTLAEAISRASSSTGCGLEQFFVARADGTTAEHVSSPDWVAYLAIRCIQAFTGVMPATKRSIDPFPVSLETGAPDFCAVDFTEVRNVPRRFPKDARERDCYRYLLEQMQATPDRPPRRKADYKKICRLRFHVTVDSFEYCWREAIKVTSAHWDQPGRRPGRKSLR